MFLFFCRIISLKFLQQKKNVFIDKEEFLCGMAILSHGTQEERLKFIFKVYDLEDAGEIQRDHMEKISSSIAGCVNYERYASEKSAGNVF